MKKHLKAYDDLLAVHRKYGPRGSHPLVNANHAHALYKTRLGLNGRVATALTAVYGSMWFVYMLVMVCAGWMLWQGLVSGQPFDPYPFAFLLFIGNLVQLLGGPIIQVGANLSSAHSELRAEADYQADKRSLELLERIDQRLDALCETSCSKKSGGSSGDPVPPS